MFRDAPAALALASAIGTIAIGCGKTGPPAETDRPVTTTSAQERDIHSYARPEDVRVTHVALDLDADFDARVLSGTATLTLHRNASANQVVLDTKGLEIQRISGGGSDLKFALGGEDRILGRPLTVDLPPNVSEITIAYRTSPEAGALQWLQPSQTAGGKRPYLYSQGQAIFTRTWIPTQDSPGVRQTYSARITVPRDLHAVMSAEQLTPKGTETATGRAFEFRLTHPVPPYLIAIGVGDLAYRQVGPRTGVYTEPAMLDAAANELIDLEKMVTAAESLLGPYRWGRFDVLVLPPSFPLGGMENPRLTFATPTIIAGDRSLVSLIAHELAHSWSGNLVTNATWSGFWLNEGFTTYVENRLMEVLYGADRARMLQVLDRRSLDTEIKRLGPTHKDTILNQDLAGRDPDDAVTDIAYEKGATFLRTIEAAVGRDRFDSFLRGYFDRHAFHSITTAEFFADLRQHLLNGDRQLEERLKVQEWLYQPGLPDNAVVPSSDTLARVEQDVKAFAAGAPAATIKSASSWSTQEWQHFVGSLPDKLTPAQLADLDRTFRLSDRRNAEVLFAWLRVAIRNRYEPAMPALERFLTSQGRRKFLKPLYEDLMKTDWGKEDARRIYGRARPLYHAMSTNTLDPIVSGSAAKGGS
ncbi:MAG TPA: M1 family metallopeptidase [Vicinamibacterales bacterium]|nr:M1 family metallopeptidase [Vicinamibacterales bacterium]